MADRRDLRKQNQLRNQPNPSPQAEPRGSLGRRDPNTGRYNANLDDGGTFQATRQFDSSVRNDTEVQLNQKTKTADYKKIDRDRGSREGIKEEVVKPASGNPTPQFEGLGDEENNPDNPYFGNCGGCNNFGSTRIDCASGYARIEFSDGSVDTFKTPALLEYGAKVKFRYKPSEGSEEGTLGAEDEIYISGCPDFSIDDGLDDLEEPYDEAVYGKMIYQQRADSVSLGGGSASNIKEFQIYQNNCSVKVVAIAQEGGRQIIASTNCENLAGSYSKLEPKDCIQLGEERKCGVDLESLKFFCVIRVYRLCFKYQVRWVKESTGEIVTASSCDQIGYRIESVEDMEPFPLGDSSQYGRLKYDSGIPKEFVVRSGGSTWSSGTGYAYFQIYQKSDGFYGTESCTYQVVGWKEPRYEGFSFFEVINPDGTIVDSGVNIAGDSRVVYEGGCGFEIELGNFIADQVLRIYDSQGQQVYETPDFVPGSVQGCTYLDGTGVNARFRSDASSTCQGDSEEPVLEYEKETESSEETQIAVTALACIEESNALNEEQVIEFSDQTTGGNNGNQ